MYSTNYMFCLLWRIHTNTAAPGKALEMKSEVSWSSSSSSSSALSASVSIDSEWGGVICGPTELWVLCVVSIALAPSLPVSGHASANRAAATQLELPSDVVHDRWTNSKQVGYLCSKQKEIWLVDFGMAKKRQKHHALPQRCSVNPPLSIVSVKVDKWFLVKAPPSPSCPSYWTQQKGFWVKNFVEPLTMARRWSSG